MISGNNAKRIKQYLPIDHIFEEIIYTKPEEGEELWGIPFGYYQENQLPFIEHQKDGKVTQTVNCSDISVIQFDVENQNKDLK